MFECNMVSSNFCQMRGVWNPSQPSCQSVISYWDPRIQRLWYVAAWFAHLMLLLILRQVHEADSGLKYFSLHKDLHWKSGIMCLINALSYMICSRCRWGREPWARNLQLFIWSISQPSMSDSLMYRQTFESSKLLQSHNLLHPYTCKLQNSW